MNEELAYLKSALGIEPFKFRHGAFQLSNIAVFVQHAKSFERPEDAVKSMGVGFVVNSLMMVMVVLGLMTIYTDPDAAGQSVPTLFMVQNGVGASFMTPLISILIILGAVSTAVNMVAAMVKRIYGKRRKRPRVQAYTLRARRFLQRWPAAWWTLGSRSLGC